VAQTVEAVAQTAEAVAQTVEAVAQTAEAVAQTVEAVAQTAEAVAQTVEAVAHCIDATVQASVDASALRPDEASAEIPVVAVRASGQSFKSVARSERSLSPMSDLPPKKRRVAQPPAPKAKAVPKVRLREPPRARTKSVVKSSQSKTEGKENRRGRF
jgi:hypothetical protein